MGGPGMRSHDAVRPHVEHMCWRLVDATDAQRTQIKAIMDTAAAGELKTQHETLRERCMSKA